MRKKTFSLILSGILPITALSFTAFANGEDASAVLKCDDPARVVDILRGSGFDVWEASEAYVSNIK